MSLPTIISINRNIRKITNNTQQLEKKLQSFRLNVVKKMQKVNMIIYI